MSYNGDREGNVSKSIGWLWGSMGDIYACLLLKWEPYCAYGVKWSFKLVILLLEKDSLALKGFGIGGRNSDCYY